MPSFERSEEPGTGALPVNQQDAAASDAERRAWLHAARSELDAPGVYIVYDEGGTRCTAALGEEAVRIGRSLTAEVRFDDATVSRRHALALVKDGAARILDDRSLNGVYVNGARAESAVLSDGDEITIGRHLLLFIDATGIHAAGSSQDSAELTR